MLKPTNVTEVIDTKEEIINDENKDITMPPRKPKTKKRVARRAVVKKPKAKKAKAKKPKTYNVTSKVSQQVSFLVKFKGQKKKTRITFKAWR